MQRPAVLELASGRSAPAARVALDGDAALAVSALALGAPRPTLVVVGGAAGLDEHELAALRPLAESLVRAAGAAGAAIVDGGTYSGVMRLLGRAHEAAGATVPLIGVVVEALAALPGEPVVEPMAALEPRHTHFVLVPGATWGDEAPWIARVAKALAGDCPSVTVLVNGGEIAWTDVAKSVDDGRPVLAVAGTGRTADALAAAVSGTPADERAAALAGSGLVEALALRDDAAPKLEERVKAMLSSTGGAHGG